MLMKTKRDSGLISIEACTGNHLC